MKRSYITTSKKTKYGFSIAVDGKTLARIIKRKSGYSVKFSTLTVDESLINSVEWTLSRHYKERAREAKAAKAGK